MAIQIRNTQEFSDIRNNLTGDYELANDIDFAGVTDWQKIGPTEEQAFKGTIDGKGFAIKNLTVDNITTSYSGVFGYCENFTLKNIIFDNLVIDESGLNVWALGFIGATFNSVTLENLEFNNCNLISRNAMYGAGLIIGVHEGYSDTDIFSDFYANNINFNECSITSINDGWVNATALLCGSYYGGEMGGSFLIENCSVENKTATVTLNDYGSALLVGECFTQSMIFNNCKVKADIFTGPDTNFCAGVASVIYTDYSAPHSINNFINCSFEGNIIPPAGSVHLGGFYYIGGITAYSQGFSFKDCHVKGDIFGTEDCVGGVAGLVSYYYNEGNYDVEPVIENCSFEGNIRGGTDSGGFMGMIMGDYRRPGIVRKCWAKVGDLFMSEMVARQVVNGGFSSYIEGFTVENCYVRVNNFEAHNNVPSDLLSYCYFGGFAGEVKDCEINNVYTDVNYTEIKNITTDDFDFGKFVGVEVRTSNFEIGFNNVYINDDYNPEYPIIVYWTTIGVS